MARRVSLVAHRSARRSRRSAVEAGEPGAVVRPSPSPPSQMIVDVAEGAGLVEVDEALLEQLEHGEEAHDDLEPLDQRGGEPPERDARRPGAARRAAPRRRR